MMEFNDIVRRKWKHGLFFTNTTGKFCFFPVSKNANSTISRMFFQKRNISKSAYKTNTSKMVKFTCVRDPLTRIVSGYLEIEKLRHDGSPKYTRSLPYYRIINPHKRFRQFICDIEDNVFDTHIMPQVYQMYDPDIMDYILLYDILLDDIRAFVDVHTTRKQINYDVWINRSMEPGLQKYLMDVIRRDSRLETKIIDMYSEDYDLYTKVKKEKYERVVKSMESV